MINTQYDKINGSVMASKSVNAAETAISNAQDDKGEVLSNPNRDFFERSVSETADIYSPETVAKGASSVNSTTAATSTVSTDLQKRNIPTLLSAKNGRCKGNQYV